jgi:hypothetical protein
MTSSTHASNYSFGHLTQSTSQRNAGGEAEVDFWFEIGEIVQLCCKGPGMSEDYDIGDFIVVTKQREDDEYNYEGRHYDKDKLQGYYAFLEEEFEPTNAQR